MLKRKGRGNIIYLSPAQNIGQFQARGSQSNVVYNLGPIIHKQSRPLRKRHVELPTEAVPVICSLVLLEGLKSGLI